MHAVSLQDVIQALSLLVLATTVFVSLRQLKSATAQARASADQAESSEKMARYSLQQTELMRAQIHHAFRPIIGVSKGLYGINCAVLNLSNFGAGAALNVVGVHRSGYRLPIGTLQVGQMTEFQFKNDQNLIPCPVGPDGHARLAEMQKRNPYPLRLEYQSVTGANCWTTVDFPLGREGEFMPETAFGIDLPLQAGVDCATPLSARG